MRIRIEMGPDEQKPFETSRYRFHGVWLTLIFVFVAVGFGGMVRLFALDSNQRARQAQSYEVLSALSRMATILGEFRQHGRDAQTAANAQALRAQLAALAESVRGDDILAFDLGRLRQTAAILALLNPAETVALQAAPRRVNDDAEQIIGHIEAEETATLRSVSRDIAVGRRDTITFLVSVVILAAAALAAFTNLSQARAHRRAESTLRESETRYRYITEYASDVIFQLGLDLTREYFSPACFNVMGYRPEELVGTKAGSEFHPEDEHIVVRAYDALLAGSEGEILIARSRHRDGRWVWIEARVRLVRDRTGAPTKIIGVMTDITARRSTEIALQASEAKYRALYNHAPALMYSLDAGNRIVTVTDEFLRVFGYSRDEVIDRPSLDFMTPDSRRMIALIARPEFIATGAIHGIAAQFVTRHGEVRDVLLSAAAETETENTAARAIVAIVDVTERRAAEDALRASEAQYRIVADNAGDLIMRFDAKGRRTYVSPSSIRIVGFSPEEITAMAVGDFAIPEDRERLVAAFQTMMSTGEGTRQLLRTRHRDGRVLWLEANCTVLRDPTSNAPCGIMSFARDVTERQTAIEQAEEARREAELANRAKSEFLATMSHEIRTPMNGVLGFATILLDTPLTDEQKRLVSLVKVSGEALLAIINDILDLSKIEAGALGLEAIPASLREIVDGSISVVRAGCVEKALELVVEIAPDVPQTIIGDPNRLRQVLLNLLSNAIKFTEKGSVTLRIGVLPDDRGKLLFEVIDTGIGIPETRLHLLFQVFSQIDSSTTRKFGGTGLGLAISRRLIEAMPGGRIGVESNLGVGSRFWFTIDLETAEPAAATSPVPIGAAPTRAARVLVAEDMAINQMVVEGILSHAGHHVEIVSDGAAAVAAVAAGDFDLVLMDMHMPGMDGLDATRAIRVLPGPVADIPIIALSANAMQPEIELCHAAGMNGHLAKPIEQEALLQSVALWSNRRDRRAAAGAIAV